MSGIMYYVALSNQAAAAMGMDVAKAFALHFRIIAAAPAFWLSS